MEAQKITLLNKLIGIDSRQFIIPIYQRKYKWTIEQCNRLIDDIISAGTSKNEHFTGSVIYKDKSSASFRETYLVDGQQRVTTMLLIVKAINTISASNINDEDYEYIYKKTNGFLLADKEDPKRGRKLIPSENDKKIFEIIMNSKSLEELEKNKIINEDKECSLFNNYKEIYKKIVKIVIDGSYMRYTFYEGMSLLTIVEMILGDGDDPQAIFESINSLGLKLSNADLIRNYLLMTNDDQEKLYEEYWKPMQNDYIGENNMESFVFNYIMMKKSYSINMENVYKEYVQYSKDNNLTKEELIKDLFETSKIYEPFLKESSRYSKLTNSLMKELRDMAQSTAYPFLMKIFIDKENAIIEENTLDKVINLIIVYLVRRTICGVSTNSLRGFMLNLYNRIFKLEENKNPSKYYEAIYAYLSEIQTNDKLKTNSDVLSSLGSYELYKNGKFATYLLYKIENGRYLNASKEISTADEISIEHIMPQTLTDEWRDMLGEDADDIHSRYLNTLGNLSLSSRSKNSIMSNESFIKKRDILKDTSISKFVELNKDIDKDQTVFGRDEIVAREERLASIVCSKYDLGNVNTKGIKFEETIPMSCSTDLEEIYDGSQPISYELFDREVKVNSFSQILTNVTRDLYAKNPEKVRELAVNNYYPWSGIGNYAVLHISNDDNDKDPLVVDNIRMHTNYNARYAIQCIAYIIEQCGYDPSILTIYLKKDSIKTDNKLPKQERISIIRNALANLNEDNLIIYNETNKTEYDDWIKFQTIELNETFKADNINTLWDGKKMPYIAYLEYSLSKNAIFLTLKSFKATQNIVEVLSSHKDQLRLDSEIIGSRWWHLKRYDVDYKKVLDAKNKVEEIQNQISTLLINIKDDIYLIGNVINESKD